MWVGGPVHFGLGFCDNAESGFEEILEAGSLFGFFLGVSAGLHGYSMRLIGRVRP